MEQSSFLDVFPVNNIRLAIFLLLVSAGILSLFYVWSRSCRHSTSLATILLFGTFFKIYSFILTSQYQYFGEHASDDVRQSMCTSVSFIFVLYNGIFLMTVVHFYDRDLGDESELQKTNSDNGNNSNQSNMDSNETFDAKYDEVIEQENENIPSRRLLNVHMFKVFKLSKFVIIIGTLMLLFLDHVLYVASERSPLIKTNQTSVFLSICADDETSGLCHVIALFVLLQLSALIIIIRIKQKLSIGLYTDHF